MRRLIQPQDVDYLCYRLELERLAREKENKNSINGAFGVIRQRCLLCPKKMLDSMGF